VPTADILEAATLFLDLDGTLLEISERPGDVRADASTCALLAQLARKLDGRLAIISGRSLEQIDQILGETAAELAVSGSHGCEHRWNGVHAHPGRPRALDDVAVRLRRFAEGRAGLLVEDKSFGVALHYRMVPEAEAAAQALARTLADEFELHLQGGKMMVELRAGGGDKGGAIKRLMRRPPMRGTTPVFAGDDVTDEAGFAAVRDMGGHAILVGEERPTRANFALPSPAALREWLWQAVR
jgi:trehalose 6-phosphate phosphatase